jgi:phosphate:Na+ symporter
LGSRTQISGVALDDFREHVDDCGDVVGGAEVSAAEQHLDRLREGRPESLETTSLHLDVLRDLKRIHSHICSVAYPVLDAAGEMPIADVVESDPITLSATSTKPAVR